MSSLLQVLVEAYTAVTNNLCRPKTPCDATPCLNGGQCVDQDSELLANRTYKCICPIGTTGDRCEVVDVCANHNPCSHGTCVNTAAGAVCKDCGADWTCKCCDTPAADVGRCQVC